MKTINEKIPGPKELEKEIGEFLSKKFGDSVKIVSPIVLPQENLAEDKGQKLKKKGSIVFNMIPEELVAYLDQYIIKQDKAKAILSTKICTHFNRIRRYQESPDDLNDMVGSIKNNVLMIGPTGVGKTYMIKLIAKKIGVPFVKGDATKFSETGYVGGDVEDLVRALVREADGDIELAQHGIIYIDEIDKIASTQNFFGADVSRTGVQRALLKPMEDTDVEMKVPHDPVSMIQEIERFRKSGKREENTVNTKNILFIMSGAFSGLDKIIKKRIAAQTIGFGASINNKQDDVEILKHVRSEDLIQFGFESEFIGRLPVKAIFEKLTEEDLYNILKNPNNPIILGKKLDFHAYGIKAKFEDRSLEKLALTAFQENTGARGLVSAIEEALLVFENKLPSTEVKQFPITLSMIEKPEENLSLLLKPENSSYWQNEFYRISELEKESVKEYITMNRKNLGDKYNFTLSDPRINIVADCYCSNVSDIGNILRKVKQYYDEVKKLELYFFNRQDINIVLEDDAIDYIIERIVNGKLDFEQFTKKISIDFDHGLKLVKEKTGRTRFFITKEALVEPDIYIGKLLKNEYR
ncbi:MAG: ATPase [Desulfobacterium sp.]|nr:ATPase [Desulfobacterium sp.]